MFMGDGGEDRTLAMRVVTMVMSTVAPRAAGTGWEGALCRSLREADFEVEAVVTKSGTEPALTKEVEEIRKLSAAMGEVKGW